MQPSARIRYEPWCPFSKHLACRIFDYLVIPTVVDWLVLVGYRTLIITKTQFCIGLCSIDPTMKWCVVKASIVSMLPAFWVVGPLIYRLLQPLNSPFLSPCSFFPSCQPLPTGENVPLQSLLCLCICCWNVFNECWKHFSLKNNPETFADMSFS